MNQEKQKIRVMVVEDEMIQALYIEQTLLKLGYEVIDTVSTGKAAIEKALEEKPDFITMDIQLKDNIDGIEATQEIQKRLDIPVIYITGNSNHFHSEKLQNTTFIDLLSKPVSGPQILNSLKGFKTSQDFRKCFESPESPNMNTVSKKYRFVQRLKKTPIELAS
jgi:CheY-like chemotaxis protein